MKNKIVYGSDKDDFIWKMGTVYNPIEKLHYTLAKWHLEKLLKINQEAIDKMYNRVYNDIIKEMNYNPKTLTNITAEQLIDKLNKVKKYCTLGDFNAVVKLEGDDNESID